MKIEMKSFRTKVARRIFILYILCAILPVLALAAVSFFMVRDQLQEQSQKRLRREAKGIGLSIYEKLMVLRAEMQIVRSNLDRYSPKDGSHFSQALEKELRERFDHLGVIQPQGDYVPLLGEPRKAPQFTEAEARHLRTGKALLGHEVTRGAFPRLYMYLALGTEPGKQGFLMAEIKKAYFWEIAEGKPALSELCVLGADREILYSTSGVDSTVKEKAFAQVSRAHAGYFEWRDQDQTYYACFYALFLEANYLVPHWIVVLGEPEEEVFAAMAGFRMYFPVILILTMAMVFLLSMNLIRKSTGPIEILREATEKVADGDFGHQVEIETEDEFESLGNAFNEMSQRLEETQKLLIRTAKMSTMGQMAAGIFHEVKQPLAAISGLLELSLRGAKTELEKKRLKTAYMAVKRLNSILENFKSFSRTTEEEKQEGIFIHLVLDQIIDLFQHQLKLKNIELRYEKGKNIPPVLGNDQSLQQVFSNLIMNSADAVQEKGGARGIIRVSIYEKTDNVIVEVEDNGTGIPEEIQEQIFDPFFSTKDPTKGTGLGMPIIESILHRHDATIDLVTEVGVGTKFTVTFPALATIPKGIVASNA